MHTAQTQYDVDKMNKQLKQAAKLFERNSLLFRLFAKVSWWFQTIVYYFKPPSGAKLLRRVMEELGEDVFCLKTNQTPNLDFCSFKQLKDDASTACTKFQSVPICCARLYTTNKRDLKALYKQGVREAVNEISAEIDEELGSFYPMRRTIEHIGPLIHVQMESGPCRIEPHPDFFIINISSYYRIKGNKKN